MVWAARTETAGDWWGVNIVQCWLGSLAETMVQITVSDLFFIHDRGLMNSIYIWVANTGSNLAPVAAGYVTNSQGWRWVWWWFVILFGVTLVMFIFGFQETKFNWKDAIQAKPVTFDQPSANSVIVDTKNEKHVFDKSQQDGPGGEDLEKFSEENRPRNLSVVVVDATIPRKSYWQTLTFVSFSDIHGSLP